MVHTLNPCEVCGEQAGSGTGFLLSNSSSSVSIIPVHYVVFILIQVLLSGQMDKSREPLKHGCPTDFREGYTCKITTSTG